MLMWLFIIILMIAVLILIVLQFRKEQNSLQEDSQHQKLEEKVMTLESNLKKTLEIMQDLAKGVQVDRELLNQTVQKSKLLELQNAELIALISQYVGHAEDFKRINEFEKDDLK
ncbi:hypothetical protein IAE19_05265 [Acinetobacter sp. S40]|uniref:hypothetical protein n=1 Tax=unclassified Acinetobacter TaxID=196816 RepID=UPI00190B102B|nr:MULTISPECIES: hypothetical protein [unclassified Acinetobacter]MBJ9984851.1 hypothetical protein [Acinetobacter sp. S40]MBK0063158.1 hypothetical protein [Acinetobacter sp. S55]MBK0066424.1 hypothetical protein [Acinetobacter sp. S54]